MSATKNYLEKNSSYDIDQNYWEHLQCALAWDFAPGKTVDLDASAVLFDNYGHFYDVAYFNQLQTLDGGVIHSGDNTTGKGNFFSC
jgi:stress response protein SCP2